ncbi:MAG: hypothetical protein Q8L39_00720 [Burkholderiales bacterium]|nr:hypothetical protein [Burkholderiales bacterium]
MLILIYAGVLFVNGALTSAILSAIAAGILHPAVKFSRGWLKPTLVTGLLGLGFIFIPIGA